MPARHGRAGLKLVYSCVQGQVWGSLGLAKEKPTNACQCAHNEAAKEKPPGTALTFHGLQVCLGALTYLYKVGGYMLAAVGVVVCQ